LFFGEAYEEVMRKMVGGLRFVSAWERDWRVPTPSALCQARQRLGEAPLRRLFERAAVALATPATIGAWQGRWRLSSGVARNRRQADDSAALGNDAGSMFAWLSTPSLRCSDRSHMPGPTRPPMIQIVSRPAWRRTAESSSSVSGRGRHRR
jgi:hypothetical protein